MPKPRIFELQTVEQTSTPILARVEADGVNLTQSTTSSVTYKVYNTSNTQTGTGTFTVSSVMFNSLQTDARWTEDATGYNFLGTLPSTCFPAPGHHRVEIKFTTSSGAVFWLIAKVFALSLASQ